MSYTRSSRENPTAYLLLGSNHLMQGDMERFMHAPEARLRALEQWLYPRVGPDHEAQDK